MFEKERLYKDISSIIGEEKEIRGIYLSPATGLILSVVFVILLAWVGADIYQAVHAVLI